MRTAEAGAGPGGCRVLVAVVTHDSAGVIEACLSSLERAALDVSKARVVVVDNASSDATVDLVRDRHPGVAIIAGERNLGFGAGANLAIARARELGAEFVYLLNPDATVDPRFLEYALAVAAGSTEIAAVQSLLLLAPRLASDAARIDSAGNALHFLGFGYCLGLGRPRAAAPREPTEIAFASGAAVLLRVSALDRIGGFDETLFLYCEDLDLGWRLWRAGFRILLAPESVVIHAHEFARHPDKFFLLERNRWRVLLANWSARSLLVLALPLALDELALLAIALRGGWLGAKLRATRALLARESRTGLGAARRRNRGLAKVADRDLACRMTARMELEGEETLLLRFANPVLSALWAVARRLL